MADEEKEKAEKLAAAKKRFEQLKKEQQKKGKKTGGKKKTDKTEASADKADEGADETSTANDGTSVPGEPTIETNETANVDGDDAPNDEAIVEASKEPDNTTVQRKPSISVASKQRSESFRQGISSPSAGPEVQELYRKQSARIEELEKELQASKEQHRTDAVRLSKAEEELETYREQGSEMAELKDKISQVKRLEAELESTQRQLAQAQHTTKPTPRVSGSVDLSKQLETQTSSIETLELELSSLRNELQDSKDTLAQRDATIKDLEEQVSSATAIGDVHKQDLDKFKASITASSKDDQSEKSDPQALANRILVLESDLKTAQAGLDAAAQRAASLEQKIEMMTKLHRDASATSQRTTKELHDLREQLKQRDRPSHVRDASDFELGEEETETGALQARIRALEAENFDLRRGVWRDKRSEMQPDMNETDYEDVDLSVPYSQQGRRGSSIGARQTSSFQDVINSGITAFTGRTRENVTSHARRQSLGLLSEDEDFDEDAFRMAQEEDAKRRIERVKEVKRGLDNWKGWRVDLSEIRQAGLGAGIECGPVFEI